MASGAEEGTTDATDETEQDGLRLNEADRSNSVSIRTLRPIRGFISPQPTRSIHRGPANHGSSSSRFLALTFLHPESDARIANRL